jgi:hypothetical protein
MFNNGFFGGGGWGNRAVYEIMWKKYVRARQATHGNKIWHMRIACWITKATDTHSEYEIRLFHGKNGYANAPHCYVYTYIACLINIRN